MKVEVVMPARCKSSTALKAAVRPSELPTEPEPLWMAKPRDSVTGKSTPFAIPLATLNLNLLVAGRWLPERPRRVRGRRRRTKQESPKSHWGDPDYAPDGSSSPKVSGKPTRRRQREPSPASSASSISLGSTWYDSTKRRVRRNPEYETGRRQREARIEEAPGKEKGKARARDYPGATDDETVFGQTNPNLPPPSPPVKLLQIAHSDSGYLSESAGNSIPSFGDQSNRQLDSPLATPSSVAFRFNGSTGSLEDSQTEGCAYPSLPISPTPEEIDEDSYVEGMVDLESDNQATEDPTRIIRKSPQPAFTIPSSCYRGAVVAPVLHGSLQGTHHALNEAGSSTAPGTQEWHRARGAHAGGFLDYETCKKRSPERARCASIGKQVTFATGAYRSDSTEPEQIDAQVSFSRSSPTSVVSSRFTPIPSSRPYPRSLEITPGSRKIRRSEVVDSEELLSETETTCAVPLQNSSLSDLLPRIPPKSSDIPLLSRLGLGVILDKLGAKYGFRQELVAEVYSVEEGIAGTELVLREMRAQVEEVLCRRASSVIEGEYA